MKLTVAVVAYGRYKYLDEAAASIARQTRPPDEVLIFTDNKEAVRPIFQKHGVRVHTLDPRDYAAALERPLTDQELWLKLSRNGREFVKQFNYIEIANKYINLIKNLYGR